MGNLQQAVMPLPTNIKKVQVTKLSGYVDTPILKKCGTCKHLSGDRKHCNEPTVMKDPQVKADPKTGLKLVNAMNGCCNEWMP
jgi:hypothetical protein